MSNIFKRIRRGTVQGIDPRGRYFYERMGDGIVEIDETYIGGEMRLTDQFGATANAHDTLMRASKMPTYGELLRHNDRLTAALNDVLADDATQLSYDCRLIINNALDGGMK